MFTLHVLFPLVDYECISSVGLFSVGVFGSNDANLPDGGWLAPKFSGEAAQRGKGGGGIPFQ